MSLRRYATPIYAVVAIAVILAISFVVRHGTPYDPDRYMGNPSEVTP